MTSISQRRLFLFLLPVAILLPSCARESPERIHSLLAVAAVEAKRDPILYQLSQVLAEFDAQESYGIAPLPDGIQVPDGRPALLAFVPPDEVGREVLTFPREHQELEKRLYGILRGNGIERTVGFVDLRGQPERSYVDPERGAAVLSAQVERAERVAAEDEPFPPGKKCWCCVQWECPLGQNCKCIKCAQVDCNKWFNSWTGKPEVMLP